MVAKEGEGAEVGQRSSLAGDVQSLRELEKEGHGCCTSKSRYKSLFHLR
jgi:hypothetical protein